MLNLFVYPHTGLFVISFDFVLALYSACIQATMLTTAVLQQHCVKSFANVVSSRKFVIILINLKVMSWLNQWLIFLWKLLII